VILLGKQGFELIYSLESVINYGTIGNIKNNEFRYNIGIKKIIEDYKTLKEFEVNNLDSTIWLIPLIIKHSKKLIEYDASEFHKELEEILKRNGLSTNISIIWPIILFAGFAACAINNKMWANAQEGILRSGEIINKLKESIGNLLNASENKQEADIHLTKTREIYLFAKKNIEAFDYQKVTEIITKLNIGEKNLFNDVLSSLCVLWATDTMSADWYNVFNRAYNGRINNLSRIFPILGTWMGFLHGYKSINRRRLYQFSNAEFIEKIGIKAIKALEDESYSVIEENDECNVLQIRNITNDSSSKILFIAKFDNLFEMPLFIKSNNYNNLMNAYKSTMLRDLQFKYEELKKVEREFEKILLNTINI
jgi:hypothetical protein